MNLANSQLDIFTQSHQPADSDQPAVVTSDHSATSDQLVQLYNSTQSGQSNLLDNDLIELFQKCFIFCFYKTFNKTN